MVIIDEIWSNEHPVRFVFAMSMLKTLTDQNFQKKIIYPCKIFLKLVIKNVEKCIRTKGK